MFMHESGKAVRELLVQPDDALVPEQAPYRHHVGFDNWLIPLGRLMALYSSRAAPTALSASSFALSAPFHDYGRHRLAKV